ncbi:diguanylate cyclase [Catenovulum maritimum]|uniref:diguanylate cyclase n=1 Tax=Catenovulum maritimum TaxID=1513271 RepID=A0A0J8GLZ2_9ALTE|nr:diguanylate cyclase [Catenovulum maritimum]KMT63810.1 diguanylate cyclase [Catenovulum maritimum]
MSDELAKQTVLIVDDEPINIKVLGQALADSYRVKTAINGSKALNIVQSAQPPDLVLLDIQMPELDGYEVLLAMKQSDLTKNIPVIFITGKDAAEDEAKGLELGAMDYIPKPFNIPVVKARVRNQLALKQKAELLEKLVSIDGLTEIPNRRNYDEKLQSEWRRCNRSRAPLSIIMIDIDSFKPYNDNYGHSQGDVALKKVASVIKSKGKRSGDLIARYGGEEFVVLLPETDLPSAVEIAETMRQAVEELKIPHEYNPASDHITISLGVWSVIPDLDTSPLTLQKQADDLLYKAKQQGRNQVSYTL